MFRGCSSIFLGTSQKEGLELRNLVLSCLGVSMFFMSGCIVLSDGETKMADEQRLESLFQTYARGVDVEVLIAHEIQGMRHDLFKRGEELGPDPFEEAMKAESVFIDLGEKSALFVTRKLSQGTPQERYAATQLLTTLGLVSTVPALARASASDPDSRVRKCAVYALSEIECLPSVDAIVNALADPDHKVRGDAKYGLAKITNHVTLRAETYEDAYRLTVAWWESVKGRGLDEVRLQGFRSRGYHVTNLKSEGSLKVLEEALWTKEWWIRYNASRYIEEIVGSGPGLLAWESPRDHRKRIQDWKDKIKQAKEPKL